jgi:hypothetical protein
VKVTKGFSLKQPWATIVARGLKPIENRDYPPPRAMMGEVFAIHASKRWDADGTPWIRKTWAGHDDVEVALGDATLVRSAIVGVARIIGYLKREDRLFYTYTAAGGRMVADRDHPMLANPWFFGDYGYVLENMRELATPIPCKGALNFWRMPEDVEAELVAQLGQQP